MIPASLRIQFVVILCLAALGGAAPMAQARDAAFADPGAVNIGGKGAVSDSIIVEPKAEIDTGESVVNVPRRTTLFFTNKTNAPVEVIGVTTNDDLNVKSNIVSNDCSREGRIAPASRCMVVVETMPTSPNSWTSEVLLTHNGFGRIARARLTGKTSGQAVSEKRDSGFTLSTKEIKPIDFGQVDVGDDKVVRTALMINDSPENITLMSINVIAAENGFERLDQGCLIDMELKPGESCPVTLLWKPASKGVISTDLIIRHTGKLGFAVIPIRGIARDLNEDADKKNAGGKDARTVDNDNQKLSTDSRKAGTAAQDIEKALSGIPPLTEQALPSNVTGEKTTSSPASSYVGEFRLIGTVGARAILVKPDGSTIVAGIGDEIDYGSDKKAKLTNLTPKTAEIFFEGKKKELTIGAVQELVSKAVSAQEDKKSSSGKNSGASKSEAGK